MAILPKVVALSGGVGGAKLSLGLARELSPEQLTIIANTADDFEHLGLSISPDLDTVMYTLSGLVDTCQGWGVSSDSRNCMLAVERLGGPSWFALGDQDIATHLLRSEWQRAGQSLTSITAEICRRLGVGQTLLPMCNEPVRTRVVAAEGLIPFQEYFVKLHCAPEVSGFVFAGVTEASLSPEVAHAIATAELLVVCPSNPFVSIAPILAVPGMREAMLARTIPRVVVSPIVGGKALKGPAAKMMQELGLPVSAEAVAAHYRGFATHFVLDSADLSSRQAIADMGISVVVTNTIMTTLEDRRQLAREILSLVAG